MKLLLFIVLFFLFPTPVYARSGCCSHHGGVAYCGDNGMYVCNDGEESPTCTCGDVEYPQNYPPIPTTYVYPTDEPYVEPTIYIEQTFTPVPTMNFAQFVTNASPASGVFFTTLGFFIGTLFGSLTKK